MILEINKVNSLEISSPDFWTSNTTTIEILFPEIREQSCFLKGPGEIYHITAEQTNFLGIIPISNWPHPKYWNGILVEMGEIEQASLVPKYSDKYCDLKQIKRHKTFQNIYNKTQNQTSSTYSVHKPYNLNGTKYKTNYFLSDIKTSNVGRANEQTTNSSNVNSELAQINALPYSPKRTNTTQNKTITMHDGKEKHDINGNKPKLNHSKLDTSTSELYATEDLKLLLSNKSHDMKNVKQLNYFQNRLKNTSKTNTTNYIFQEYSKTNDNMHKLNNSQNDKNTPDINIANHQILIETRDNLSTSKGELDAKETIPERHRNNNVDNPTAIWFAFGAWLIIVATSVTFAGYRVIL